MKRIPFSLTLELTNQCNLRCKLCNIWREKEMKLLDIVTIKDILTTISRLNKYKLEFVSLTGGEPFLHPAIEEIFKLIILFKIKKVLKKELGIGIYSNGYSTDKIIGFLEKNVRYLSNVILGISLDGWGETHNFLRGKRDAFTMSLDTIEKVHSLFMEVKLEIKLTISPININEIYTVYDFCKDKGIYFTPKVVETNVMYYYHRNKNSIDINFNRAHKERIKKVFAKIIKKEEESRIKIVNIAVLNTLLRYLDEGYNFITRCLTPTNSLFITSYGNIHPCLYLPPIVNVKQPKWQNKLNGREHMQIIKKGLNGECPKCISYHGFLCDINL